MYNNTCKEEYLQVTIRHDGERGNMDVNESELKKVAIEKFVSIQRIKKYGQEELDYQERIARAELQTMGISTEDLELKK